jgi:hypothetical protein
MIQKLLTGVRTACICLCTLSYNNRQAVGHGVGDDELKQRFGRVDFAYFNVDGGLSHALWP